MSENCPRCQAIPPALREIDVYTTAQVAELLGCDEETIELHTRNHKLPGIKWGRGGWRYPRVALLEQLDVIARDQLKTEAGGNVVSIDKAPKTRRNKPPEV